MSAVSPGQLKKTASKLYGGKRGERYDGSGPVNPVLAALYGCSENNHNKLADLKKEAQKAIDIIGEPKMSQKAKRLAIYQYHKKKLSHKGAVKNASKPTSKKPVEPAPKLEVSQLTAHGCANIYPMLIDEEMQALAEDIRENGLIHAIVVQGHVVIDGRNRLAACKLAGVAPVFKEFDGDDEAVRGYILAANNSRRHLNAGQRAMAFALIYPDPAKLKRKLKLEIPISKPEGKALSNARLIIKWTPEYVNLVMTGEMPIASAYNKAAIKSGRVFVQTEIDETEDNLYSENTNSEFRPIQETDSVEKTGPKSTNNLLEIPIIRAEDINSEIRPLPEAQEKRRDVAVDIKKMTVMAERLQLHQELMELVNAILNKPSILAEIQKIQVFLDVLKAALPATEVPI